MKFDADTINTVAAFLSLGEKAVGITLAMAAKIMEKNARGRPPTQDELRAIAVDARAQFEALPAPGAESAGA